MSKFVNQYQQKPQAEKNTAMQGHFFQPKLTVNQPNDLYEQEADALADKVVRMEQPGVQLKTLSITSLQRKCTHCEEEKVHRKETGTAADVSLEHYTANLNNAGHALPGELRSFYEPRFGYDFGDVKIHTNATAAKSAESINALAYTSGNNIVFNTGQYDPGSNTGKQLLAHELTHVVQQRAQNNAVSRKEKPDNKFDSCNAAQKAALLPILEAAGKAVTRATGVVATAWGRPDKITAVNKQLLLDHFHTTNSSDLRDIMSNYISLGQEFSKGLKIECENTCEKGTSGNVCGYAYNTQWFGGRGPIHICFDTAGCDFNAAAKANQVALIIHEAAHRHTGVDDKAYRWEATYSKLSAADAIDNADSYGWFAALL